MVRLRVIIDLAASLARRKTELSCVSIALSQCSGGVVQHAAAQRYVAGIVYQDVYAAKLAFDSDKGRFQSGAIGHIDFHRGARNADCL